MPFDKSLLRECPTLHPSDGEFESPVEYLSRPDIRALGEEFGLVKIVPPVGWKPPFSLALSFRFHTRTQKLADLGLRNRSRKFFVENMNRFYLMAGSRPRKPWLLGFLRPVHVYDLYLGFRELFPDVTDISSFTLKDALKLNVRMGVDSTSKSLLNAFRDKIWPYARFLASNGDNFDFPSVLTDDPDSCVVCLKNSSPTTMLMCDNCDDAYHMKCLVPALEVVPPGDWFCDKCLIGSGEYGFEENPELRFSLQEFVEDCQQFERAFYSKYGDGQSALSIDSIEKIFWGLVEEMDSNIKVKYGADIHNQKVGEISGFPTNEFPPSQRNHEVENYARHPWNLTRLPFAKGSLLNHIKTKISGMTVPWLYVGSLLSTFCWHVEDHYTLSANYCHFGNIKNWYGIPRAYADKFEQHMRSLAPDLFQRQPDLLHQLVTLVSPSELVKIGIPAVYTRQGPNEFVVTFPRVYHAGFNCGFNFNEAVNFSMDSWLPTGEQAIEDYRAIKKESVFDHYTLVENMLRAFVSDDTSIWKNRMEVVHNCIRSFEAFSKRQMKLLEQLNNERFVEVHKGALPVEPITPKQEEFPVFQSLDNDTFQQPKPQGMKAVANDNDDKLCDICRTYLSYQFCNINNRLHRFGKWHRGRPKKSLSLLTPEASPYVPDQRDLRPDVAVTLAKTESGEKLRQISGLAELDYAAEVKPESEMFDELIHSAKRKLRTETLDLSKAKKRQRSLRSSLTKDAVPSRRQLKEHTPSPPPTAAVAAATPKTRCSSLYNELNQFDIVRLCLQCTIKECGENGERVPRESELIYEQELSDMEIILSEAKAKMEELVRT